MKFLSQYALYTVVVFYCAFSSAVTISADIAQTVEGTKTFRKINGSSTIIISLHLKNDLNAPHVNDQNFRYDCPSSVFIANEFKVFITTDAGEFTNSFTGLGSCKRVTTDFVPHSAFSARWNLTNRTLQQQTLELYVVWLLSGGNSDNTDISFITIPANSTCSATVENADLGTVKTGIRTSSSIKASFSGTASSKIMTIASSDMSSDGTLKLGGANSQVKVYPADSNNTSGRNWKMPPSGTLPLIVDATSGVRGNWSSSLLVSLACS